MAKKAGINQALCDKSPACPVKRMCPKQAVIREKTGGIGGFFGFGPLAIDTDKCTGCGVCMQYCPRGAVRMEKR